jgi:hypothetical protein
LDVEVIVVGEPIVGFVMWMNRESLNLSREFRLMKIYIAMFAMKNPSPMRC